MAGGQGGVDRSSVTCLICGEGGPPSPPPSPRPLSPDKVLVKEEVDSDLEKGDDDLTGDSGGSITAWTPGDKQSYSIVLKYLKVRSRWQARHKLELWKDTVPFCRVCKQALLIVAELQMKLEQIEKDIQEEVKRLKKVVEDSEEKFCKRRVYERDKRYEWMRSLMVPNWFKRTIRQPIRERSSRQKINSELIKLTTSEEKTVHRLLHQDDIKSELDEAGHALNSPEASNVHPLSGEDATISRPKRKRLSTKSFGVPADISTINELIPDYTETSKKPRNFLPRKNQDENWSDHPDSPSHSSQSSSEFDSDVNDATGSLLRTKVIDNPSENSISYRNQKFLKISPGRVQCTSCFEEFSSAQNRLKFHLVKVHSHKFACSSCEFRAGNRGGLRSHVRSVHLCKRPKKAPCPVCGKPTDPGNHKLHLWTHKNQEEQHAALSSNDPSIPSAIKRQLKAPAKTFQCHRCGLNFRTTKAFSQHQNRMHGPQGDVNSERQLCPECGRTYANLKHHLKTVHGQGGHTCLETREDGTPCGKRFVSIPSLARHKDAVHRKLRPWKCDLCPRCFPSKKCLNVHRKTHLGIRPWQCDQCQGAFTIKAHLLRHQANYHVEGKAPPKRKSFKRGPTTLTEAKTKRELVQEGKYLPPSALASWAAGREPTSHFPPNYTPNQTLEGSNSRFAH